jgi:hypothetical protein
MRVHQKITFRTIGLPGKSNECGYGEETEELLQKALDVCILEKARVKIKETLKSLAGPEVATSLMEQEVYLQVICLLEGDVVGTKLLTMLPVVGATLESIKAVPSLIAQCDGQFNVFSTAGYL